MAVLDIPKPLREKLGEEATDAFVHIVKDIDLNARQDAILIAEERLERRLTEEIGKVNERITSEPGKVNERITSEIRKVNERIASEIGKVNVEIGKVKERMTAEIGKVNENILQSKGEIIKWMFIFWASQLGAMFAFLKFL